MATNSSSSILDALHAAIEAAIRARFPDFATVEFYREPGAEGLATPACLLAMTRCDRSKDKDDGSGQMQALLRFEARVVVAAATTDAALQLGRFPGAASGAIDVIAALPEDTAAAQPGLRTWLVEWSLPVALGSNAWEETGGAVPQAFYSFVPEIGRDHEARYQPIEGAAP